MPTRAWCMACEGYVLVTPEGICPTGHPRPSLRGLEEVASGYVPPPARSASTPFAQSTSFANVPAAAPSSFGVTAPAAVGAHDGQYSPASGGLDPLLQAQLNREATRVYHDVPWYETWPGMIVVFLVLWPLGMYLLWRSPVPTRKQKWAVTAGVTALVVINLMRFLIGMSVAMTSMPQPPLP